ncbi:penicillin-binding transpeptidase domain-containing protein [Actinomadura xylanilytica]|uniref:penicillin-binding transpeptidase domain-containing protein n=1 Tax=Actinomadura xylanilytica TaxID=887459 RepID=UPI00255A8438|nr:penicillin-binding transpeptidase domain-containing protein [Actinomadura xylanilytica]MDL4775975.1 penicillin-binding transpeptidase domain-containing protein [Actinomadura xylanilytica]
MISATAGVVLVAGTTAGCFAEPSAMPTVRDFLIAWQVGNYKAAAAKTTGAAQSAVANALGEVRGQLDAASLKLALGVPPESGRDSGEGPKAIEKKGETARARFSVKVDLGENGQPWTYTGLMSLKRIGGQWKVVWDPSIINPALKPGQRLAVVTEVAPRGAIKDRNDRTLLRKVNAVNIGVYPGRLKDPQATVDALAKGTKIDGGRKLDAERLLGRVRSAPPQKFLPLLTLQRPTHNLLIARLQQIPDVRAEAVQAPIAPLQAPELVGGLGPATADRLQQVGAPYQPGDTIGVSGLQLLQQRRLAGTPTVRVVAQDPLGRNVAELKSWTGQPPAGLGTTIDPKMQARADQALAGLPVTASMVALRPSTGEVWAVANHGSAGRNLAMEGSYPPGMTFGIISAEAVLRSGVSQATKFDCPATANVGGQTITNPSKQGRPASSLQNDFAFSCATTLAQLSGKLDAATLLGEAGRFGIGKSWGLSVPHFAGSVPTPANDAEKAALAVGQGKVQVSPLSMALVAAAAENGAWKPPYLTKDTGEPKNSLIQPIDSLPLSDLKKLLRRSVTVGTAHEANTAGGSVSGVAASVDYQEGGRTKTVSWFVGSRGDLAFAVAIEGKYSASKIAAKFLTGTATAGKTAASAR